MSKFHLNKYGEPARCDAQIKCRVSRGDGEHFDGDLRGAVEWAEKKNAEQAGGSFGVESCKRLEEGQARNEQRDAAEALVKHINKSNGIRNFQGTYIRSIQIDNATSSPNGDKVFLHARPWTEERFETGWNPYGVDQSEVKPYVYAEDIASDDPGFYDLPVDKMEKRAVELAELSNNVINSHYYQGPENTRQKDLQHELDHPESNLPQGFDYEFAFEKAPADAFQQAWYQEQRRREMYEFHRDDQ